MAYPYTDIHTDTADRGVPRDLEGMLLLAAGAAWAVFALRAWSRSKRSETRRKTYTVSERMLAEVFPTGV